MIRLRHPQGVATLRVGPQTTWQELQSYVADVSSIAPEKQACVYEEPTEWQLIQDKAGFPPRPVTTADLPPQALLCDPPFSIRAGDTLLIDKTEAPLDPIVPWKNNAQLTIGRMPDDNSCLFHALHFVQSQCISQDGAAKIRQIIAHTIQENDAVFSEAVLGADPAAYTAKLMEPATWGGYLELLAASIHYHVQIWCWDVASGVRHVLGEPSSAKGLWILAYTGIHYDVIVAKGETTTTIFDEADESDCENACQTLVDQLQQRNYTTSTATFTLYCNACGERLHGEKEAVAHARSTGHTDLEEMKK